LKLGAPILPGLALPFCTTVPHAPHRRCFWTRKTALITSWLVTFRHRNLLLLLYLCSQPLSSKLRHSLYCFDYIIRLRSSRLNLVFRLNEHKVCASFKDTICACKIPLSRHILEPWWQKTSNHIIRLTSLPLYTHQLRNIRLMQWLRQKLLCLRSNLTVHCPTATSCLFFSSLVRRPTFLATILLFSRLLNNTLPSPSPSFLFFNLHSLLNLALSVHSLFVIRSFFRSLHTLFLSSLHLQLGLSLSLFMHCTVL
jgi:hypothetical protein